MTCFHSIRWRLQLWHGLLLVSVLAGFGYTAWRLERATRLERTDQELEQRVSVVLNALPRRGPGPGGGLPGDPAGRPPPDRRPPNELPLDDPLGEGLPPEERRPPPMEVRLPERDRGFFAETPGTGYYYVVWRRDGQAGPHSAAAPVEVPRPGASGPQRDSRIRGTLRERYHFTPMGEVVLAGRDIGDELSALRQFAWVLAGAGVVVLALGLVGGAWISTRALRPIADISDAAARITGGDLSQRIHTEDTSSELGGLARTLNDTFSRLEASFTRQAQFTADAAHELRTPVAVLLLHAQNGLATECASEEHREAFAATQRAAQRLRRLTECLLVLARLDAGQPAAREDCALDQVTNDAAELLRPLAQEQGLTLELSLAPTPCRGDPEQLGQVVTNLVANAIHYNRPGGRVSVNVAAENGAALLTVRDTGIGIPPDDLPHLFERFYRGDTARANPAGRTGLGLAITKAIVEAHGGSIEVNSTVKEGSTFSVRLPN